MKWGFASNLLRQPSHSLSPPSLRQPLVPVGGLQGAVEEDAG